MIRLTLGEVVQAMGGKPIGRLPTVSIGGVSTDSRTTSHTDLFFAIPGERFDGHAFVPAALARGAVAAVIDRRHTTGVLEALRSADVPRPGTALLVEVDDTVAALGRLAAFHRRQHAADVIAVVGSNGKTTTKAMIHHILSGRRTGRASPKSYNNAIGVPLTLLSAEPGDDYLVVEIGTNAKGEVAQLAGLASPDLVVLTCLGEEHLEGLGDLAGVAEEECAALRAVRPQGFAAVNIDAPDVRRHIPAEGLHVATFGYDPDADVRVTEVRYEAPWLRFMLNARFPFRLRLAGAHNAVNAAAAVTIARREGCDYAEAAARLDSFAAPPMRNEIVEVGGVTLVNDAYNANPQSALAAIDVLTQMPCRGQRIAVFGEMRELGAHSAALHQRVAEHLRRSGIARVLLVGAAGELMGDAFEAGGLFGPSVERCDGVADCLEKLAGSLRPGDVVLLKASRVVGLDRVVEPLRDRLAAASVR